MTTSQAAIDAARPARESAELARTPYRLGMPAGMVDDVVIDNLLGSEERLWVPQSDDVAFRPLVLGVSQGYYANLLRVRRSGVLSRHRHAGPVHAVVLRGRWHYLEHDWVANEGGYVFEPPGETHTLVVPEDVDEMITLFVVSGALIYVDPDGRATGYEDCFTKLALARQHYEDVGLGSDFASRFVR